MEIAVVNGKKFQFVAHYKNDTQLRDRFNALTQQVWKFDFEKWFTSGYWDRECTLYSLMDEERVVAHTTVTRFRVSYKGEDKIWIQLGTVMTDPNYVRQGLSRFLMEQIQKEWADQADGMFLFANDTVLDFYPKFGFVAVNEYQASKWLSYLPHDFTVEKLDMQVKAHRDFLLDTAAHNTVPSALGVKNSALVLFYAYCCDFFCLADSIYYLPELDAIAIAEYEGDTLFLHEVLSADPSVLDRVIAAMTKPETTQLILGFMPGDTRGYTIDLFKEEDSTLFVTPNLKAVFEENKYRIPLLSHT